MVLGGEEHEGRAKDEVKVMESVDRGSRTNASGRRVIVTMKDVCERGIVGGKAFNVARLAQKGFPVPKGFCITTEAYDYFMDFNKISEKDENIRDKIKEALMPPLLVNAIRDAYMASLGEKPCAVRSSSPAEDLKSASFAGQYRTFLNVKGEDALLEAIRKCWESSWSQSAIEYRKKMGIGNKNIKMAVLVQEMLSAEASGVMFTEEQIVVEAVWGSGDILVGGRVTPARFTIARDRCTVVERKVSPQEVMSRPRPAGEMEVTDVPEQLRETPVLDDGLIRTLCTLGRKVEDLFGCPQDIEWALCNGEVFLLQARPISVKQTPTVWSRANAAETQPGYVTYLSRIPENKPDDIVLGLRPLLERFGIRDIPGDITFREYIYGHVYLNMTTIHSTLGKIPGLSPEVLDQSLGHSGNGGEAQKQKPTFGVSALVRLLPGTLRVIQFFLRLPDQAQRVIPHSRALIEDIRQRNLQEMHLRELEELVWDMYEWNSQVFQVHSVTALAAMAMFGIVQKFTARIGEGGAENELTIGLEGMSSSQLGVEIWNLARSASELPGVAELVLSRREDILEELEHFPEGRAFLEDLNTFMGTFGDRCSEELELSVPRWGENPSFVLSMVANYLGASVDPLKAMEEQKKKRLEATQRILTKLSRNPVEKLLFKKVVEKTQQYIVVRENLKTTWVRGISALRTLYLAIAVNLAERGILDTRDDIFYLKMTEVSDVLAGNLGREQVEQRIAERKEEEALYRFLDVPEVVVGKPPPLEELRRTAESKKQLEGVGCSHGIATGRARVVLDPVQCSEFNEGDILVAPITDPGWSPLFVTAGGLVMELGGTLSHGVIIAREYGIPAVVGVKNATKIIMEGQRVTVDGNRGIVYLDEEH